MARVSVVTSAKSDPAAHDSSRLKARDCTRERPLLAGAAARKGQVGAFLDGADQALDGGGLDLVDRGQRQQDLALGLAQAGRQQGGAADRVPDLEHADALGVARLEGAYVVEERRLLRAHQVQELALEPELVELRRGFRVHGGQVVRGLGNGDQYRCLHRSVSQARYTTRRLRPRPADSMMTSPSSP